MQKRLYSKSGRDTLILDDSQLNAEIREVRAGGQLKTSGGWAEKTYERDDDIYGITFDGIIPTGVSLGESHMEGYSKEHEFNIIEDGENYFEAQNALDGELFQLGTIPDLAIIIPQTKVGKNLFKSAKNLWGKYGKAVLEKAKNSKFVQRLGQFFKFGRTGDKLIFSEKDIKHIFRDAPGHMPDTASNRKMLIDLITNKENYLGPDRYGTIWYGKVLKNGKQIWAGVRGDKIRYGGINNIPRKYNPISGLSKNLK